MTDLSALKLALLAFWAAWFAIVLLTNVFGFLKATGRLPPSWRFASKNYELVTKATAIYQPRPWLPGLLFGGVLAWQLIATAMYAYAFFASLDDFIDLDAVNAAFTVGILLWAAFMLADEITLKYEQERTHELLFIAQLASLAAIHLL